MTTTDERPSSAQPGKKGFQPGGKPWNAGKATPAGEAARQWNTNGGQPGSAARRADRKAAKARDEQRRADAAQLVAVRWACRYAASRPGPDKAAARALLGALTAARSVDAVRVQMMADGAADGRLALLDRLAAGAADVKC
jgi:hypothetical protein